MQILPAIDIKDGQAVRLFKGDFNQKTVVNPDVIEQAKTLKNAGIQFIHLVDLDGALDGRATNRDLIAEVKKISGLGIEVGGGIRTFVTIWQLASTVSLSVQWPSKILTSLEQLWRNLVPIRLSWV